MTSHCLLALIALTLAGQSAAPAQARQHPRSGSAPPEPATPTTGRLQVLTGAVLYVLDGDTLVLRPHLEATADASDRAAPPRPLRIRLAGVDAPELCQRGGGEARQALAALVQGRQVRVQTQTVDRYTRIVGRVMLGPDDVAAQLVAQGLAWSSDAGRHAGPYAAMEATARTQHRGVFADPQPLRPKDFRERHGACPHAPGSRIKQFQPGNS